MPSSSLRKVTSAPSERPIQLRCIVLTCAGQSIVVEVVEQAVGVVGDAEEPLLELADLDLVAAALAAPVDDLLVGQHGLVVGAPLDGGLGAVGQAALEELEEDPLRPAVVARIVGGELARPVERDPHSRNCSRKEAIAALVESRGCWPVLIAWFSAGSPKAS